ncbi:MAG: type II toxin-antitoxin system HicB family antitoxin [Calditrichia bacterium]|nr:type II toxin-antitoxin system HicB family antitoxin [Calditrichia bacterium]
MAYKVGVVIEKDEYGYYAYCPELEGCQSQGDTFEEVSHNIKEAIGLYLETTTEEERKQYLSHEIYTTSVEVHVA